MFCSTEIVIGALCLIVLVCGIFKCLRTGAVGLVAFGLSATLMVGLAFYAQPNWPTKLAGCLCQAIEAVRHVL